MGHDPRRSDPKRAAWHPALLALLALPALLVAAETQSVPPDATAVAVEASAIVTPIDALPEALRNEAKACAECHEEEANVFATSPHGRAWSHSGRYSASSCATCHGDGAKHIDSGEAADIVRPEKLPAAEANAGCLECHNSNENQAHWMGSQHQRRGVACVDCHDMHQPAASDSMVDAARRTDLCMSCHKDKKAQMMKASHHPVREGKMACTSCHNPHGSMTKGNLIEASVNELCYDCHAEKRGPFLWEHAPVRESCSNCHDPHGSNHLKLQKTSVPYLCQQCHMNTRHPGTLYDATRLPTLDNPLTGSNRLFNRACVDCHSAIHGSNHPSGPYLGH